MTDARLAAIRARLAAATPGPWEWDDDMWLDPGKGELYYVLWNSASVDRDRVEPVGVRPANARFIANAPADIAYLLERLAEAEAAAAELARLNQPPTIIQCGDPAGVAASKLADVTAQRDTARAKLAEAWGEGADAALEHPTQLENPYMLPGEDGPR